jgi:hypothetical protein
VNTQERWLHIEKLEADNRESKEKSEALKREHDRKMQSMTNISNAVVVAMSIFNPCVLLLTQDKKNDKE